MPKAVLQSLIPALPADRRPAIQRALETAPDAVPLVFTSINKVRLFVDTRFGGPIKTAQEQTTVLNVQSGGSVIPLLDLSKVQVETADASLQSVADDLNKAELQLDIMELWVPLGAALLGLILIIVGVVRRAPRADATSGSVDPELSANATTTPESSRTRS